MLGEFLQNIVFPTIGNTLTIVISALAGAISIISARGIYQRRRTIAALHAELVDNFYEIHTLKERNEEEESDPLLIFNNTKLSRDAYDNLRQNDPALYIRLDAYSDSLASTYKHVGSINELGKFNFWKRLIESLDISQTIHTDGGDYPEEEPVTTILDSAESTNLSATSEVEEYISDGYFRRIFYWKCLIYSPETPLDAEETDPSEAVGDSDKSDS